MPSKWPLVSHLPWLGPLWHFDRPRCCTKCTSCFDSVPLLRPNQGPIEHMSKSWEYKIFLLFPRSTNEAKEKRIVLDDLVIKGLTRLDHTNHITFIFLSRNNKYLAVSLSSSQSIFWSCWIWEIETPVAKSTRMFQEENYKFHVESNSQSKGSMSLTYWHGLQID